MTDWDDLDDDIEPDCQQHLWRLSRRFSSTHWSCVHCHTTDPGPSLLHWPTSTGVAMERMLDQEVAIR